MVEKEILVTNPKGIHARPSAAIVKAAGRYTSEITLIKDTMQADAKSILSVLMLCIPYNTTIKIRASGEDEKEALQAVEEVLNIRFDNGES